MEEKSQAEERETKKDEVHEKDARNKRYAADERPVVPQIRLRRGRNEARPALRRPVLTYIRLVEYPVDEPRRVILGDFSRRFSDRDSARNAGLLEQNMMRILFAAIALFPLPTVPCNHVVSM